MISIYDFVCLFKYERYSSGYDELVDEWALGVLLVYLLTLKCPFVDKQGKLLKDDLLNAKLPIWEKDQLSFLFDSSKEVKNSKQAKFLCRSLLCPDRARRMRCEDALSQTWFSDVSSGGLIFDEEPLLAFHNFEEGFIALESKVRNIGNKLASGLSPVTTSVPAPSTNEKAYQREILASNRRQSKAPSNECCICFQSTGFMDHVCPRCANVVCAECLPHVKKAECPGIFFIQNKMNMSQTIIL